MKKFNPGSYKKNYSSSNFIPSFINHDFDWSDKKTNILLGKAMRLMGELDAYSHLLPDVDFFIKMHVAKEAVKSSMIEGTKTNIGEIVLLEEDVVPEKRGDWQEVQNYIKAMNFSIKQLEELPLSMRLIKDTHKILLSGVRGKNKLPGKVRKTQNWIGGSSLENALFIPPHTDDLSVLLTDLEKFWHNKNLEIPVLMKIAITHYQFETIHPFLDGNGRVGRLIIVLQLIESKIINKPTLYLSSFFEKNRALYYDSLTMVREKGELEQWIKFFLSGVIETAESSIKTFKEIIKIRFAYEEKIMTLGVRSRNGKRLLLFLFSQPIVNTSIVSKELGVSFNSANRLINSFVELKILSESTGFSRNRLFVAKEYLSLFR